MIPRQHQSRIAIFVVSVLSVGMLVCAVGCQQSSGGAEGSESAARSHLESELNKWIGGSESQASTQEGRLAGASPISYMIKSVVADKPDFLALSDGDDLPDDWRTYPAFRANVGIEFKSQAGTPLEKVATYTITWNKPKKTWHITERF